MAYHDLREYLQRLDDLGLLNHVEVEVDKDWEIAAVSKHMFQRYAPARRRALYFHHVKGHDIPVVAGVLGANRAVYAAVLSTTEDNIFNVWNQGSNHPIPPRLVDTGPCQEVVLLGEEADLTRFPIPVWTVEHDAGPYITAPLCISRDHETGENNVGTYRLQLKGPRRLGMMVLPIQHGYQHLIRHEQAGKAMPIAIALGTDPTLGLCSVAKFPAGTDEFAVSGGLRGQPLELCPAKTVPLNVPATAEIVIEGYVPAGVREWEGPFGEYTGFMGAAGEHHVVEVTAITHRRQPIYQAFISEMPPSESSVIRGTGRDLPLLHHLKNVLRLPVVDLHLTEAGAAAAWCNVAVKRASSWTVSQLMNAIWGYAPLYAKYLVIVDDDVDVRDPFQVQWAISYMARPDEDVYIQRKAGAVMLDPSSAPASAPATDPRRLVGAKMCIDATRKHEYPPKSVPPREHLDLVGSRWSRYGFQDGGR